MHRAVVLGSALLTAILLLGACSSGHPSSGYTVAGLKKLLLTPSEAALPGYLHTSSDGESQGGTTFANEFLNDRVNQAQVNISVLAAQDDRAASKDVADRLAFTAKSLRDGGHRSAVPIGTGGVVYSGRAKIGGALETSVYFTVGRISAQVVFVGVTQSLAVSEVERVARVQAGKLTKAA